MVDHLVGLVVKASASRAEDAGFGSSLWHGDFSGWSHCNGPGVVQRKDRQKKEFHDQSDYR